MEKEFKALFQSPEGEAAEKIGKYDEYSPLHTTWRLVTIDLSRVESFWPDSKDMGTMLKTFNGDVWHLKIKYPDFKEIKKTLPFQFN